MHLCELRLRVRGGGRLLKYFPSLIDFEDNCLIQLFIIYSELIYVWLQIDTVVPPSEERVPHLT